jgi:hypothetical protein
VARGGRGRPGGEAEIRAHIDTGETGWFSSPALVDLTGDRRTPRELALHLRHYADAAAATLCCATREVARSDVDTEG